MNNNYLRLSRIFGIGFFLAGFLVGPISSYAAEIAVIISDDKPAYDEAWSGLQKTIQNGITRYSMKGSQDMGLEIIKQVKIKRPKIVVAIGALAAALCRAELPNITVIYCMVVDPEKYGLAGSNITGVKYEVHPRDQFSFLRKLIPGLRTIGVIYNPRENRDLISAAREAAGALGLTLLEQTIASEREIAGGLKDLLGRIDIFWFVRDSTLVSRESFQYILTATVEKRIPIFTFSDRMVKSGALVSISPDYRSVGEAAGKMVRDIIQGKSPGEVAVYYPEGEVSLNLTTADTLGVSVPGEVLKDVQNLY